MADLVDAISFDYLIKIALCGIVVFLAWRVLQPRYALKIIVDTHGLQRADGVAKARLSELRSFFAENAPHSGRLIILGARYSGRWRFRFRGSNDPALQQRIRNFLLLRL